MGQWLSRALVESPVQYGFCSTEIGYKKMLKQIDMPLEGAPPFVLDGYGAVTHFFTTAKGTVAIVCMRPTKLNTKIEIHALLTHEAVHIWQDVKRLLNERDPSHEFEAYAIQHITQNLVYAYEEQIKPKRKAK